MPTRVLVVEDDPTVAEVVRTYLGNAGLEVDSAADGVTALAVAARSRPALVVLDLMLPGLSGLEVCRRLREARPDLPVIMLTALGEEADRVVGLELGADDYLVKPFSAGELLARVRAHLRRRTSGVTDADAVVEFGDVKIDRVRRTVERGGEPLHLTPIEYRLLTHLTAHPHCVVTHRQILKEVWGSNHAEDTHYVRVYMGHLRRKVEADPSQPRHLVTETGIGYRFVP